MYASIICHLVYITAVKSDDNACVCYTGVAMIYSELVPTPTEPRALCVFDLFLLFVLIYDLIISAPLCYCLSKWQLRTALEHFLLLKQNLKNWLQQATDAFDNNCIYTGCLQIPLSMVKMLLKNVLLKLFPKYKRYQLEIW